MDRIVRPINRLIGIKSFRLLNLKILLQESCTHQDEDEFL